MIALVRGLFPIGTIIASCLFVQPSSQQHDPIRDFCRRFGHQTAVIDNKLLIDGGQVNWNPLGSKPVNDSNPWLSYNDLNHIENGMPKLYANLSKNSTIPSVTGGILWADTLNRRAYLFGGEYASSPPNHYSLVAYDVINNKWDDFGPSSTAIPNTAYGGGVAISERGEGYYYGGWQSDKTEADWSKGARGVSTVTRYNMDTNSWAVLNGIDPTARAEGAMVYLPASDGGMLIYFGGVSITSNGNMSGMAMSTILIYDINNAKWYNQTATGNVPGMRRKFCAAATWPADQSSYNIYLYGGLGVPPNGVGWDDSYILSIPSFTWIRYYPDTPENGAFPHHSSSCNIIKQGQMLVIGGTFPTSDQCDIPSATGTHNLDLSRRNVLNATWYQFLPNITDYLVPPDITQKIGGSARGAATLSSPVNWGNPDLAIKFPLKATYSPRIVQPGRSLSEPTSSPNKLSGGTIAGISISAFAGITALLGTCLFILRRKHKARTQAEVDTSNGQTPFGDDSLLPRAQMYDSHSPSSMFLAQMNDRIAHSAHSYSTPVELPDHPRPEADEIRRLKVDGDGLVSSLPLSANGTVGNNGVHNTYYHPTQPNGSVRYEGLAVRPSSEHSNDAATYAELPSEDTGNLAEMPAQRTSGEYGEDAAAVQVRVDSHSNS